MASSIFPAPTGAANYGQRAPRRRAPSELEQRVQAFINASQTLDTRPVLRQMFRMPDLLQLAHAAGKEQPCNSKIISLQSEFARLIIHPNLGESGIAACCFDIAQKLLFCATACESSQLAMALALLNQVDGIASAATEKAKSLLEQADRVGGLATEARIAAGQDFSDAKTKLEAIKEINSQIQARQAKLEAEVQSYKEELKLIQSEEKTAKSQVRMQSLAGLIRAISSVVIEPLKNGADGVKPPLLDEDPSVKLTAEKLREKEAELTTKRAKLENAEDIEEKKSLSMAIAGLEAEVPLLEEELRSAEASFQDLKKSQTDALNRADLERKYIAEQKFKLREKFREWNAALKAILLELQNASASGDEVAVVKKSLESIEATLGKIQHAAHNFYTFWGCVHNYIKQLNRKINAASAQDNLEMGRVVTHLRAQSIKWIALFEIDKEAALGFRKLSEEMETRLQSLPTSAAQRAEIVAHLAAELEKDILETEQNLKLEVETASS